MDKIKVRIYEIEYDTDGDEELKESLPKEMEIEIDDYIMNKDKEEIKNEINQEVSDYITDMTGFCHYGFLFDII